MGTGTLTSSADGDIIPASDHNQLVNALLEEIVPRDATRAPTDEGGQLGTSLYRFLYAYVSQYFIGTSANNLRIYEGSAGEIWLENGNNDRIKITDGTIELLTNNTTRFRVTDSGIDWTVPPADSIPSSVVAGHPFISYTTFDYTYADAGPVNFYTVPYRCKIEVELVESNANDPNKGVWVYADTLGFTDDPTDPTLFVSGRNDTATDIFSVSNVQPGSYPYIFNNSGAELYLRRADAFGSATVRLHIFRLS